MKCLRFQWQGVLCHPEHGILSQEQLAITILNNWLTSYNKSYDKNLQKIRCSEPRAEYLALCSCKYQVGGTFFSKTP